MAADAGRRASSQATSRVVADSGIAVTSPVAIAPGGVCSSSRDDGGLWGDEAASKASGSGTAWEAVALSFACTSEAEIEVEVAHVEDELSDTKEDDASPDTSKWVGENTSFGVRTTDEGGGISFFAACAANEGVSSVASVKLAEAASCVELEFEDGESADSETPTDREGSAQLELNVTSKTSSLLEATT